MKSLINIEWVDLSPAGVLYRMKAIGGEWCLVKGRVGYRLRSNPNVPAFVRKRYGIKLQLGVKNV